MYEEIERDMPEAEYNQMDDEELATWSTDHAAKREIDKRAEQDQRDREEDAKHVTDDLV